MIVAGSDSAWIVNRRCVSHGLRSLLFEDDDEDENDWVVRHGQSLLRFQSYFLYQGGEIQFVDWLLMRDSSVSHYDDPVTNAENLR